MADGSIQIQIIDLENTSGTPYIAWVKTEGTINSSSRTSFTLQFLNDQERYSMPVVVRGIGPSLQHPNALSDPSILFTINGTTSGNDNWQTSPNAATISGRRLNPTGLTESAEMANPFFNSHSVTLQSGAFSNLLQLKRGRIDLIRGVHPDFHESTFNFSGTNGVAWLTYDVSSGVNNKKVFAYSLEILDLVSGLDGNQLYPDLGQAPSLAFYSGRMFNGACAFVDLYLATTGQTCVVPEEEEELQFCLPSGMDSGQVSGTIQQVATQLYRRLSNQGSDPQFVDNSAITTSSTSLEYVVYTGAIDLGQPLSGDIVCFRSYNYDYSGIYSGQYGISPPHAEINLCWTFGVDFNSATGLAQLINNELLNVDHPLWNKDICVDQSLSGYFENGPLLKANASGQFVNIESQRLGSLGAYEFSFSSVGRPTDIKPNQNSIKYLWPRNVKLLGSNNGTTWTQLDSRTNVLWERSVNRKIDAATNPYLTGLTTPARVESPSIGASGGALPEIIYAASITGTNKCGLPFSQNLEFFRPPSGSDCFVEDNWDEVAQGGIVDQANTNLSYSFLKTGWKFNQTGEFNYYKLELSNFFSSRGAQHIENRSEFYVSNINFYGVESGNIPHTGVTCLYGANYSGQIKGYTTGFLSGVLTGNAISGKFCVENYVITGIPSGSLRFNNAFGKPSGNFTGLLTACVSGTGYYAVDIQGYFWNTGGCLQFSKPVSGFITGSGLLSGGPYLVVRDSVIPNLTGFQIVEGSGYGMHSGIIPNFRFLFDDIFGFYDYTGTITGNILTADSGCIYYSNSIVTLPPSAKSFALSGTRSAENVLNFNSPETGDIILINDTPIIYQTNSGFAPPTYFSSISELKNIINSGSGGFLVTGDIFGSNILLKAVLNGVSGNGVVCSSSGSATKPTFASTETISGDNFYFDMAPRGEFTGLATGSLCATGFFTRGVTGNLTGQIKQLDFIRNFTGVWNIITGEEDFRNNQWRGNGFYINSGFSPLHYYSGHPEFIPITVIYTNSPLVPSNDFAKLTITGYDINMGIEMILSGQL